VNGPERTDLARLAVLCDLDLVQSEVADGPSLAVPDDRVEHDDLGARAERGRRLLASGIEHAEGQRDDQRADRDLGSHEAVLRRRPGFSRTRGQHSRGAGGSD